MNRMFYDLGIEELINAQSLDPKSVYKEENSVS